jgi:hypothetical protein
LDEAYLKETREEEEKTIKVYQIQSFSPSLKGILLNVVAILSISKVGEKRESKFYFVLTLHFAIIWSKNITAYGSKSRLISMMQDIVLDCRASKTIHRRISLILLI